MEDSEARRVLTGMAEVQFAGAVIPTLVNQVMRATDGGDWPLREAAMEALLRRGRFAKRDALKVAGRPKGSPFGCYQTRRKGRSARPYATQLLSLSPLSASCDCPDFLHNGLGVCKHVLAVLQDLASRPRKLARASEVAPPPAAGLAWDPVRPLTGAGDWLSRVSWTPPNRASRHAAQVEKWFARTPDPDNGHRRLNTERLKRPGRRAQLVADLLAFARAGGVATKLQAGTLDAALVPLLEAEAERLATGLDLGKRALDKSLRSLKQRLYPYQREGVEKFLSEGRLLLADDMGLGKTAQSIAACHVLFDQGAVSRGLLVVPAALKPQWLREWTRFSSVPAALVDGSPAERARQYATRSRGVLIIGYEQLLRDLEHVRALAPEVVVLDEAQRIKNWETKTAAFVKQLQPRFRLVLTGTPMENRLEELASIMQWVDRSALEPVWRLEPWHVSGQGARHLDTLRQRLRPRMLRRVRKEVLDQLPERTDTRVPVPMTEAQTSEHEDYDRPIAKLVRTASRRPLTRQEFLRLMSLFTMQRMICNGLALSGFEGARSRIEAGERPTGATLRSLFSPKLEELRALVQALVLDQGQRVVIFSQWRRMLDLAHWAVGDLLADAGLRAVFFTGKESRARRTRNIVDFHDDEAVRVLFASDAGGVGLNLQRAASCCINLELPWNPAVLEQRIGRVYRLGQEQPVEVYNLISESGIEARIAQLVGNKQALFTGLFDGDSDEVTYDQASSFMDRVASLITPVEPDDAEPEDEDADETDALAPSPGEDLTPMKPPAAPPPAATTPAHASPSPAAVGSSPTVTLPQGPIMEVLGQVRVERNPQGELQLTAPPQAAAAVVTLLEGLAQQLRQAASADAGE